jgi:hypothetical protein
MGVRRLFGAAIVGLGLLVFAGSAQACSCARRSPGEALRAADAAIAGELLEVVPRDEYVADYRYEVMAVYKKGPGIRRGRTVIVRSGRDGAACGLPVGTGRRYGLLLGEEAGGGWVGGSCGVLEPGKLRLAAAHAGMGSTAPRGGSVSSCTS